MMTSTLRLLIFEDNADDITLLKEMTTEMGTEGFAGTGFEVTFRESFSQGAQYLRTQPVDLIILDLNLVDSRGLHTLDRLREIEGVGNIPIIVLTVMDDKRAGIEAVKMGAQEYLVKSVINAASLGTSIRYAIERHRLKLQLEQETRELEQSEDRFIEILTNTPDGVVIVDNDNKPQYINPAAAELLGRQCGTAPGKPFELEMETGESKSREIQLPRPEGEPVTIEMRGVKTHWKGQDARLISLRDITGKKKLLTALSREKDRLDITMRSIGDGVITMDENGVIRLINRMAIQMIGITREEAVGQPLARVIKLEDKTTGEFLLEAGKKAMKVDETANFKEWILMSGSGLKIPIEYSCAPVIKEGEIKGLVLVIRDVTEKREWEENLIRSRNLEALGVLARGIAHEYNNILTSTLGYISLAKAAAGEENKIYPWLKKAEDAGFQAKAISHRLLTFSRGGEPQKRRGAIVKTLEQAVKQVIKPCRITFRMDAADDIWPVMFDPGQVDLAVGNILKNAVEAMDNKGCIEIRVKNAGGIGRERGPSGLKPGNYVNITITDRGCGIPPGALGKIFDPYFTSKERAEGIGLTTANSIIQKHGGLLQVESKQGNGCGGTTVTLWLPAAVTLPEPGATGVPGPVPEKIPPPAAPAPQALEKPKIMVMDDEELVREIAGEMLDFLDFDVVTAEDGDEALELYRAAMKISNPIKVVILDLVVQSGMGGKECIKKLREIDPQVKAVVSSGYSDDPVVGHYRDYGFQGVLPKPYKIDELKKVIHQLIN